MSADAGLGRAVDIRQEGAVGDGRKKDTAAIQRAIDRASAQGGGVVLCPPGDYLTGSLQLKSRVTLHLAAGATLRASTEKADYDSTPKLFNPAPRHPDISREHLIWARDAEDVAITGQGAIDGQGDAFFGPRAEGSWHLSVRGWRPVRLVAFIACRNVLLEDITIRNAPGWTVWPLACDVVRIHRVTIRNNPWGPNTDGIDPDSCRDVLISDCHLDCGDDCIALKTSADLLAEPRPCEDVVVTNCTLRSTTCAVRIGYEGDAPIRRCTFSNLAVSATRTGINMLVPRHAEIGIEHGPTIEGISFSNLVMETRHAFFLWIGDDAAPPGGIRDVTIADVDATTERGCHLGGSRSIPLEGLALRGVRLRVRGEMDDEFGQAVPYPYRVWEYLLASGPNAKRGLPHALYLRHARQVSLRDVRVEWGEVKGPWRSALRCEGVEGLDVADLVARQAPGPAHAAALHLTDCRNVSLRSSRALEGTGTFLRLDGAESGGVTLTGNDLAAARTAFDLGSDTPSDALRESANSLPRG